MIYIHTFGFKFSKVLAKGGKGGGPPSFPSLNSSDVVIGLQLGCN